MASKSKKNKVVYQEFGSTSNSAAFARAVPDLPPQQQNIRIQATRAGRKGKTVTVIAGLQHNPESLSKLLKKLKATNFILLTNHFICINAIICLQLYHENTRSRKGLGR